MALENQTSAEMSYGAMGFTEMGVTLTNLFTGLPQLGLLPDVIEEGGVKKKVGWALVPSQTNTWTLI